MFNLFGVNSIDLKLRAELIGKMTMAEEKTFHYINTEVMNNYDLLNRVKATFPADFYIYTNGVNPELCHEHLQETKWGDYVAYALSTWNQYFSPALQISNACQGITGELAECYLNPSLDEIGDLTYYRNILRYRMADGFDFTVMPRTLVEEDIMFGISMISDVGKKIGFHNKLGDSKTNGRYSDGITIVDIFIQNWCNKNNLTHWDVMDYNVEKLSQRHGKSFNSNY